MIGLIDYIMLLYELLMPRFTPDRESIPNKPGGHPQWPSDRAAEFKSAYPREFWSHKNLTDILDTAIKFTADESLVKGEYFSYQFNQFHEAVKDIPGVIGVFGTGYPFYAYQDDGSIADIPEIQRYQRSFQSAIERDRLRAYGGWLCGACELACDLPDLKKYCKPCDSVDFKPRDIFKALPDLDYWVVVEDAPERELRQQELEIQARAKAFAFESSDSPTLFRLSKLQNMPWRPSLGDFGQERYCR